MKNAILVFSLLILCQISLAQTDTTKKYTKEKAFELLNKFRDQILSGEESFCLLAIMNSYDPGSASNCGDLGLLPRGALVPEFEAEVYKLKPGEISKPFVTEFGYHIVQLIERKGEEFRCRHIMLRF